MGLVIMNSVHEPETVGLDLSAGMGYVMINEKTGIEDFLN